MADLTIAVIIGASPKEFKEEVFMLLLSGWEVETERKRLAVGCGFLVSFLGRYSSGKGPGCHICNPPISTHYYYLLTRLGGLLPTRYKPY